MKDDVEFIKKLHIMVFTKEPDPTQQGEYLSDSKAPLIDSVDLKKAKKIS